MPYVSASDADRAAMLDAVGRASVDELFSDIPEEILDRFRPTGLAGASEMEVTAAIHALARETVDPDAVVSFHGGGLYDHHIPSVVKHMVSRSEFATAYTPYQPELSQGTLTAMFEYQTMVCELTGMEIANASMYDGASALAEAVLMAERIVGNGHVLVSAALFPYMRRVVDTYCWASGLAVDPLPWTSDGRIDRSALSSDVSGVVIQSPNAFGVLEDLAGIKDAIGEALLIVSCHPLSLAIVEPPGSFAADIVVGEGQSLGLPPSYGGPLLGLFATRRAYLRQLPGRIASRTVDVDGNIGYTMAAQTREQHIRRERATSNLCTNAALCALAATVFLAAHGERGLRDLARVNYDNAHFAAQELTSLPGVELVFPSPFFNEFTVRVPSDPERIRARLRADGIALDPTDDMRRLGLENALRVAVTERRSSSDVERLVRALREAL
ncbi:MAG: aminomethyl-transferring glycine dehydrogenase subunit GcvPA [Candidatus Bipolaricaulota bacterium]|nr:MAG: aminomethyl-transferring glycine dehydrogenase subunit GcvPA [Candidatus Bipolaricaulota bacterium]